MKDFISLVFRYLPSVLVGVHAANTVAATNTDKKAVVLAEVTGIGDAIAAASGNPQVQAVSLMIDIAASIINALTKKKDAPAATPPAIPATAV